MEKFKPINNDQLFLSPCGVFPTPANELLSRWVWPKPTPANRGDVWKKKVDMSISADGQLWDIRGDTWGWDGSQWKKISEGGPERMLAALGYDATRKKLVLFGGGDAWQTNYADTWEFQNDKWIKLADNGTWKWNGKEYEKVK